MIKRIIFIVFGTFMFYSSPILGCDVCGSSTSNMGIGLLTNYRSNFLRLSYFDTRFESNKEQEYAVSDRFMQSNLSFRYTFGKQKRVRLTTHIPFGRNIREIENEKVTEKGLSDIRFMANYALLNNVVIGKKSKLYLEVGGGFSLPTGKFDEDIYDRNLPENFNIGKGAIGYIAQFNAVLSIKKYGIVFGNNYQVNANTKSGYHFGNQFNSQLTVFRTLKLKPFNFIPNLGVSYENTSVDNYANDNRVHGTGGSGLFFTPSLNFKTQKWFLGIGHSIPLAESYSEGEVNVKGRMTAHISYIF